jgi:uncharacterized membrane protein YheB (UPF0754 family)
VRERIERFLDVQLGINRHGYVTAERYTINGQRITDILERVLSTPAINQIVDEIVDGWDEAVKEKLKNISHRVLEDYLEDGVENVLQHRLGYALDRIFDGIVGTVLKAVKEKET